MRTFIYININEDDISRAFSSCYTPLFFALTREIDYKNPNRPIVSHYSKRLDEENRNWKDKKEFKTGKYRLYMKERLCENTST